MVQYIRQSQIVTLKLYTLFHSLGCSNASKIYLVSRRLAHLCYKWTSCEGVQGLTRWKSLSNLIVRAVLGLGLDRHNLDCKLRREFELVYLYSKHSHLSRLYVVSVLSLHRLIYLSPEKDTVSITEAYNGEILGLIRLWVSFRSASSSLREKFVPDITKWKFNFKWHISGSSGPNGSPAFDKFLEDTWAVFSSDLSWKILLLFWVLPIDNRSRSWDKISNAFDLALKRRESLATAVHSRLAFLSDKGGKTRVVAIVDILSQSLLKPVHQRCNKILRRIPQDGTFDQDKQRRIVQNWTLQGRYLHSIDLKSCTDRFPRLFQALVVYYAGILTFWQTLGWLFVIAHRTFVFKDKGILRSIRYRVGQPMGALSSWPVMAVSHHALVQLSYKLSGGSSEWFEDYSLLGDDIVIADPQVAKSYKRVIALLGMPYSPIKSFECKGVAEFAKSLFRHGEDLKPFPLGLLVFRKNTLVGDAIALANELSSRGYSVTISEVSLVFPKKYRWLTELAMLSPKSDRRCFGLANRSNDAIFESLLLAKRIDWFLKDDNIFESTHRWACIGQPFGICSPHIQIGLDNSGSYPVRNLGSSADNTNPRVLVGLGWIAYDPVCWPSGLPHLGDRDLNPGPSWKKANDDKIFISSISEMNRLIPGYFWPSCNRRFK